MDRTAIQDKVKAILAQLTGIDDVNIPTGASLADLEVESMNMLVLWESLEHVFSITIADSDIASLTDVPTIVDYVAARKTAANLTASKPPQPTNTVNLKNSSYLRPDGVMLSELEIGMHLTGRNNLSETPLLREIGHLRWQHLSAIAGVPSKDVVDEDGERLYPTFFFVEVNFPPSRPMATYGENDAFTVVSTLRRFGLSMLDGEHYLFPAHWPESLKCPPADPERALDDGVPYLRFSNSFVKQWGGAQWLKQSRPNNPGFNRIRETEKPPDSYAMLGQAKENKWLIEVPSEYVPLTQRPMETDYHIVPDRDLNGAGLLYFANYPTFLDIAERQILSSGSELSLEDSLLDQRTLLHRKSAYLSNAASNDVLRIKLQAWVENPFLAEHLDPAAAPIRLFLNYEMRRASDQRLMLVSTARKVVVGQTLGETNLLDFLRAHAE